MVALTRTVRFSINPDGSTAGPNGYPGVPAMSGLGRFYEIAVRCRGQPDPVTGYLVDIRAVDRAVRTAAVPRIAEACALEPTLDPTVLLGPLVAALAETEIGPLVDAVTWRLSPYYAVEMSARDTSTATIRVWADLAAAHRLHVESLSPEENRAIFGRCNNPNGHGHNYRVESAVRVKPGDPFPAPGVAQLERVIDETIVRRFDHKHLNHDTVEFATGSGCIPSVENMARVFFELLEPRIADEHPGAALASVTVWETDRTCGTYPA
jgi:6-pyruvoyltetrahydropterin/6-carboxytetrahydropterin synthase